MAIARFPWIVIDCPDPAASCGEAWYGPVPRHSRNTGKWVKWIAAAALGWQRLPPMGR